MTDKAMASVNTQVLPKNIKAHLSGFYNYSKSALAAASGDGWIYNELNVAANTSTTIIAATDDFLDNKAHGAVDTDDTIPWICIQHTGTTDGSTVTTDGIMIALDGAASYNDANGIFLNANETVVLKLPYTVTANLRVITVTVTSSKPSAAGTDAVRINYAAVITNVD